LSVATQSRDREQNRKDEKLVDLSLDVATFEAKDTKT